MDDVMPTSAELQAEWTELFGSGSASRERLLHGARTGALRHKRLHSACWKTFMGLLPPTAGEGGAAAGGAEASWPAALAAKREEYAALKLK